MDEVAFWRVEGQNPDKESPGSRPSGHGHHTYRKLIVIVLALRPSQAFFTSTIRDHYGKDNPDVLIWKAATSDDEPEHPRNFDRSGERTKDPSAASAEWDAEFREDIEDFLNLDSINACVDHKGDLPPQRGEIYHAFVDPSGGRVDRFTVAIGHQDFQTTKMSVDLLRGWKPPIDPSEVVGEIAELLKQYRVSKVVGDRYAGAWVSSSFDKHGVVYEPSSKPKSDLYLSFEGHVNTRRVQLPDHKQLITELVNLERRRSRAGKDTVDHPPRGSRTIRQWRGGAVPRLNSD